MGIYIPPARARIRLNAAYWLSRAAQCIRVNARWQRAVLAQHLRARLTQNVHERDTRRRKADKPTQRQTLRVATPRHATCHARQANDFSIQQFSNQRPEIQLSSSAFSSSATSDQELSSAIQHLNSSPFAYCSNSRCSSSSAARRRGKFSRSQPREEQQAGRQPSRQADRRRQAGRRTILSRQAAKQTSRQADRRQTGRQADKQAGRQAGRRAGR
jgi:hypothetical protein